MPVLGAGEASDGDEHHGVAVAADALGIGKLSHLAGLHGEGTAADFRLENLVVGELLCV